MTTTDPKPLDLDAIRAMYTETEDCVDWHVDPFDVLCEVPALIAEVERLRAEVVRRDGWRKAKDAECVMHTRGWRQRIGDLERSLANALNGSVLGRVEALRREATQTENEPADGTLIQVDERWVYVRTGREVGQRCGDWWPAEADPEDETVHPLTFGEILGFDEPGEDRVHHSVEVLIPASNLGFALNPPREP